ncbi:twin-arginine translocase TatA/TatE family subunit [Paenibacillus sp. SYP-B3998]|uniref:Sec-independent protein translocase protein TatA n=1 Tax=Paenibacillus sp. SYP-B3998 TaxID=2678564 RepID=A0A6G3ZYD3_9BACL|nr:twin-arginine translocase TatA/TatE family subunit [Paenibacillus sp. SYP-B3998]NEW07058.1 twin-arginine translocase TatA/TatE family subunit [Paenibacillus sp. SYP-B3998]
MFQNIGFTEILLIAIVALVLFGPQKLPEIGRAVGRTISEFKKGTRELLSDKPLVQPAAETPANPTATQSAAESEVIPAAIHESNVSAASAASNAEPEASTAEPASRSNTRRLPD